MRSVSRLIVLLFMLSATFLLPGRVAGAAEAPPPPGKDIVVYNVGNSLTRCIPLERLAELFEAAGGDYDYGMQLGGGHRLEQHLSMRNHGNAPGEGRYNTVRPYDTWDNALKNHRFDALVLQPFKSELDEEPKLMDHWPWFTCGDLQAAGDFIDYARAETEPGEGRWDREHPNTDNVATDRFYIYATWPGVGEVLDQEGEKTFAAYWKKDYTGGVQACRDFYEKLVDGLNERHPDLPVPVRMIPAGDVLARLDEMIRAGELPGIEEFYARNQSYFVKSRRNNKNPSPFDPDEFVRSAGVLNFYADGIHMNDQPHNGRDSGTIGSYVVALTHYATLTGESPVGLTAEPYEQFDPEADAELIAALQRTVWEVVAGHPATGVPAPRTAAEANYVWWEAEEPAESEFPERSHLDPRNERERDVLSGGAWLTRGEGSPGRLSASYRITVPADGTYELWVRRFGRHGRFRWRFDGGPWRQAQDPTKGMNSIPLDITEDRYVTASWYYLADEDLGAGEHEFTLELLEEGGIAAIDCFVLHPGHFHPWGRAKPGDGYARAPDGWFAFEPGADPFGPSPLDMSRLNHRPAGSLGRVQKDGDRLVFEKTGDTVRFWGVTAVSSSWMIDKKSMDYLAKRLAKMGVNMVRFHVAPYYETEPGPQTDGVHYLAAALKREGIYCGFNWYCLAAARVQESWGLEGFEPGDRPHSLHLFYPPLQKLYRQWARTLFGTVNPYTGMTLAEDPATAYIELIDEDNYLFWTFRPENLNPRALPYVEREFADWLKDKYGTLDAALQAWGEGPKPDLPDRPEEGRIALYPAMMFGGADWMQAGRNPKRASDQLRFMVEDTREFYVGMKEWLHDELGYDGLVVGTNWKTVDERVVGPLDFYANMGVDVTARNTYFGAPFKRQKFHPWMVGDVYQDKSLLRDPLQALTRHIQYGGYPHFITEGGFTFPNRFRTEEQLLMSGYASLQGIDGLFPFVLEPDWNAMSRGRWPIQVPATMAQYPAAALIYRRGYVEEGPVAMNEALKLEDLYNFEGASVSQSLGLDDFRAQEVPQGVEAEVESLPGVDPLAFYVGRVMQTIGPEPGKSQVLGGLPSYIDRENKVVRSATGQMRLDWGTGLVSMNAPRAQGAAGFLAKSGVVDLDDVRLDLKNEYGSAVVVTLDGRPLADSERMLLQVMSEDETYHWRTESTTAQFSDDGPEVPAKKITSIGTAPICVRKLEGTVSLKRDDASELKVVALDLNGYPRETLPGGADRINLRADCLYYLITR